MLSGHRSWREAANDCLRSKLSENLEGVPIYLAGTAKRLGLGELEQGFRELALFIVTQEDKLGEQGIEKA